MKLEVRFWAGHGSWVAYYARRELGLDGVKELRQETGVTDLDLSRMDGVTGYLETQAVTIELDEQTARESGLFDKTNTAVVTVPPKGLSGYIELIAKTTQAPGTGEITMAKLQPVVAKDAVLDDWIEAGFPTEWSPEIEQDQGGTK